MKIISNNRSSYIPLWIYTGQNFASSSKLLPFTELGKIFLNEFSVTIRYSCVSSVNATSWNDFLAKDMDTIYSVLTFVLKYLWESDDTGVAFLNRCDHFLLIYNAHSLQKIHQSLADEATDMNSKWRHAYIADRYAEYENYLLSHYHSSDLAGSRLAFA